MVRDKQTEKAARLFAKVMVYLKYLCLCSL